MDRYWFCNKRVKPEYQISTKKGKKSLLLLHHDCFLEDKKTLAAGLNYILIENGKTVVLATKIFEALSNMSHYTW